MSILSGIETEFQNIINDARSVPEKIAAIVGLHTKTQEIVALEPAITAIIEDAGKATADKVEAILAAVGKL